MIRAFDAAATFLNGRTTREKMMVLVFVAIAVLAIDYFFWIKPTLSLYSKTVPELAKLNSELSALTENEKNKVQIEKKWKEAAEELAEQEKAFIEAKDVPLLFESLSKIAKESGLKITSLQPIETTRPGKDQHYFTVPIKMSALTGTHELGLFLSKLENAVTFFGIENIRITSNHQDDRRHLVELSMVVIRKNKGTP